MSNLLIYVPKITNRVKYTFHLIFGDILNVAFQLTTSTVDFKAFAGAKFSYTPYRLEEELFFNARNLLFENGIDEQNITVFDWQGEKVFFATGKHSAFPFDPFAASFYLVSRYEEYLPHIRDNHDRFDAKESIAFRHGFLQKPVVNIWSMMIKEFIISHFPDFSFPETRYQYLSTIDIDNAYAYKEKGLLRTLGGYVRSVTKLDFKEVGTRTKVLLGLTKDPYDTYDLQLEIQKKYNLHPIYFFLLADYGINDKNVPVQSRKFQSLIKAMGDYAEVGIHPSFGSNEDTNKLKKEIERLSKIMRSETTRSRQHFLKLTLPDTYRNLIDLDITDDYTMGYASQVGFRAGICSCFNFYDLDLEIETKLKIHPFAVMDSTLNFYMKNSPKQAITVIKQLIEEVKTVNGTFISLWHNETISNEKLWYGWRDVYEEMVKLAVP